MNEHDFLHALNDIDDDLLEDAARKARPILWLRFGAVAAALVLLAAGVAFFPRGENDLPVEGGVSSTTTTTEAGLTTLPPESATDATTLQGTANATDATTTKGGTEHDGTGTTVIKKTTLKKTSQTDVAQGTLNATTTTQAEVAIIPHWKDKTLTQKFPEAKWNNATYAVSPNAVNQKQVKEKLATITVTGQDVYTDKIYTHSVTLYALDGINPTCAVAVQYAGDDGFYPARNFWYVPKTLGQFIDDLSLRENLSVGEVSYSYTDEEGHRHETVYEHLSVETVWEMLLDDTSLKNVYDQQIPYYHDIGISVHIPIVGQRNVSLALTEDGHIITNILDTGKAFYIGQDKVQAFIAYVTEHCALKWEHVYERTPATTVGEGDTAVSEGRTVTSTKPSKKPE